MMKKYIQSISSLMLALTVSVGAMAQDAVIVESENFNAATIPAGWVTFGNDPVDPLASSQVASDGWIFGETDYLIGFWDVPASPDASGFAISNDDDVDQDKSLDFLGSPLVDLVGYDSLELTFDLFLDGAFGSTGSLIVSNDGLTANNISFTLPPFAGWNEITLTVANGQELIVGEPFAFTNQMVFGFVHDDGLDWASGVAIDNFELTGFLPACEATGTQMPASPVAAVGGSTTTISTMQNTGGQYSVVTNIAGSTQYDIAHSGGAYVTVRTGSASGPILDAGFAPLSITTLSTDDLYIVWTDDEFCGTGGGTATNTSSITGGAAVCAATSGTLENSTPASACLGDELVAATDVAPSVPAGFQLAYVVTTDPSLTVVDGPNPTPTYTPTVAGTYTIHAIVFDPADAGTIVGAAASGGAAVAALFEENGGALCGSLDVVGATYTVVVCPDNDNCEDATPLECGSVLAGTNVNSFANFGGLPQGVWYSFEGNGQDVTYSTCQTTSGFDTGIWLLTSDDGCTGLFTIEENNDDFCGVQSQITRYAHPDTTYYLFVGAWGTGAATLEGEFTVDASCACPAGLDAGTLTANATTACLDSNGEAVLSATEGTAPVVPEGYGITYVLTSNPGLIIEDAGATPDFTVDAGGEYTIHTLVSANTLDLGVVVFGTTPATAVLGIVTGDDNICAALDVTGTGTITVNAPEVGATVADASEVCLVGTAEIGAESDGNEVVPAGYAVAYVLTTDPNLTIVDANTTGDFTVATDGDYIIHTLVYDPTEIAAFGPLVGLEGGAVAALLFENGGDTYCASLDVTGAPITVIDCTPPANDLCAGAIVVTCGSSTAGNTEFATATDAPATVSEGLWYVFTGTGDNITASVCGATWDTEIVVSEGGCGSQSVVASDDDGCPGTIGSGLASEVTFLSTLGVDYYIYVADFSTTTGAGGNTGEFDLTITCVPPATPLANDEPCDAIALVAGLNGTYTNVGATAASWEETAVPQSSCNDQLGWCSFESTPNVTNSTWFSFVAPASGKATVTIGGDVDSQVALFSGTSCQDIAAGTGTFLAGNDDGAGSNGFLALCDLNPGETYFLMVDGYANDEGEYTVTLTEEDLTSGFSASAAGLVVDFTDASTSTNTIEDWAWDFDDAAATSTDEDPTHTFSADGTYNVCLTVTDENGCEDTYCENVQVADITTSIAEAIENGMAVYPNPSNGEFVVEISGVEADVQLVVMDVTGRTVFTEGATLNGNFRKSLNLNVAKGTYLLQVATVEGLVTRKIQIN